MELIGTRDPAGAEGDFVFPAIDHRAFEGGFHLIVHVFGGAGGDEAENFVGGVAGFSDDAAAAVVAAEAPCRGVVEARVVQFLDGGGGGGFDDAEVIEPDFACAEEAHVEFDPLGIRAIGSGGRAAVGIGFPCGAAGFIAGRPCAGGGIVRAEVAQFEGGAAAVRRFRPIAPVEVADFIDRVAAGVTQFESVTRSRERAREGTEEPGGWVGLGEGSGIEGDAGVFAGGEGCARGEGEVDSAAEVPSSEVDGLRAAVGDFDPFVIRLAEGLAWDGGGDERAEVEFEAEDEVAAAGGVLMDFDGESVGACYESGFGKDHADERGVADAGGGEGFRTDGARRHAEALG